MKITDWKTKGDHMKIIDWKTKGNAVRFYLGNDELKEWYGDDWDNRPYEHNAGKVYSRFVAKTEDINFDFDDLIIEPHEGYVNSYLSKNDFRYRKIPCLIIVKSKDMPEDRSKYFIFEDWLNYEKSIKVYFGDDLQKLVDTYIGDDKYIRDDDNIEEIKTIEYRFDRHVLQFWDREDPDNFNEIDLNDIIDWDEINDEAMKMMEERFPKGTIFVDADNEVDNEI